VLGDTSAFHVIARVPRHAELYIGATYILQEFPDGPGRFKGGTDFRIFLRHFFPHLADAVNHAAVPSRRWWRVLENLFRQSNPARRGGPIKMLVLRRKTRGTRRARPLLRQWCANFARALINLIRLVTDFRKKFRRARVCRSNVAKSFRSRCEAFRESSMLHLASLNIIRS